MADIQKTIFTNANGDNLIVIPPFTTANAGNVLQINQDGTGFSWVSLTPEPPTPSYNYILLNNFISPMPETMYDNEDFCNIVPTEWYSNDYQTDELVSTTPGDPMIDSDTPIDFSSKGIQTGIPCGIVDYHCCDYKMPCYSITNGALSNGTTIELWYKSDYTYQDESSVWLMNIRTDSTSAPPNLILSVGANSGPGYEMSVRFDKVNGQRDYYNQIMTEQWNDGEWHHYALSYDASANKIYLFFDGMKVNTIDDCPTDIQTLFTNVISVDFAQDTGYGCPYGRFAQIAICDECKWTDNFTVPTVAY